MSVIVSSTNETIDFLIATASIWLTPKLLLLRFTANLLFVSFLPICCVLITGWYEMLLVEWFLALPTEKITDLFKSSLNLFSSSDSSISSTLDWLTTYNLREFISIKKWVLLSLQLLLTISIKSLTHSKSSIISLQLLMKWSSQSTSSKWHH